MIDIPTNQPTNQGYCYSQAVKLGVSHGRLPINDHVTLNSREVLAVNHGTLHVCVYGTLVISCGILSLLCIYSI